MGGAPRVRAVLVGDETDVRAVLVVLLRLARIPVRVVAEPPPAAGPGAWTATLTADDLVVLDCSAGDTARLLHWLPHLGPVPAAVVLVHPRADVFHAVAHVLAPGSRWLSPDFPVLTELDRLRAAAALSAIRPEPVDLTALSRREHEVVELVADGLSNADIAEHLDLSPGTVKTYVARGKEKLGRSTRDELREVVGRADGPVDPLPPSPRGTSE